MVDIEAVRERAEAAANRPTNWHAVSTSAADVPTLLAALIEEQTVHAKTMDNFEGQAESWLEERTRLLDRYAKLEAQHEWLRGEARKLRAEVGLWRDTYGESAMRAIWKGLTHGT